MCRFNDFSQIQNVRKTIEFKSHLKANFLISIEENKKTVFLCHQYEIILSRPSLRFTHTLHLPISLNYPEQLLRAYII